MAGERTDTLLLYFSGARPCPVLFSTDGWADDLEKIWDPAWRDVAIIGDATVVALYGLAVQARVQRLVNRVVMCPFPPGEEHKTRETKQGLEDQLLKQGLGRQTCVVALGGGISLDVAGFLAATYMRGIPFVSIPTSLLAQVDAAIGGKTGVNTPFGKNLVGAFHQPAAVLVDSVFLKTLPSTEWVNGLAEMVKHAVIADANLFDWLGANVQRLLRPGDLDGEPLRRCVEIKASVVQQDEREGGLRAVLNFGHTVGHAVEAASRHAVGHGRAVGLGMVVEAKVASALCGMPAEDVQRLEKILWDLGVIGADLPRLAFQELLPFLAMDKKSRDSQVRMPLPDRIGHMAVGDGSFTWTVPLDLLERAWNGTSP